MVIGEKFAWGHLGRTGGDATIDFFLAFPELIRFADPVTSPDKHTPFSNRKSAVQGKVLALNIRRLPAWVLSTAHHRTRYASPPDHEPRQMPSPRQMAASTEADEMLLPFSDDGKLEIDRWLRTEFLADDFLAFISEFTEISEAKRQEILELARSRRGTSLVYDHDPAHWFSRDQIEELYRNNPFWAEVERQVYGDSGPTIKRARSSKRIPRLPRRRRESRPMGERELLARKAQALLDTRASKSDAWEQEPSELDQANHDRQIALLGGRRYGNVLEIGCGCGLFTRRLAEIADRVIAVDVSPAAIARARTAGPDHSAVEFQLANPMDYDVGAAGPWDLVVMSETIYEYGWLYPLFDVGWLASELFAASRAGGRFVMANTYGAEKEYLLSPWLINTYRDLFLNVGYRREAEEVQRGTKDGVEYETLITLFAKPDRG